MSVSVDYAGQDSKIDIVEISEGSYICTERTGTEDDVYMEWDDIDESLRMPMERLAGEIRLKGDQLRRLILRAHEYTGVTG